MAQTLDVGRYGVVMMYLPSDFECIQGNLLKGIDNKTSVIENQTRGSQNTMYVI